MIISNCRTSRQRLIILVFLPWFFFCTPGKAAGLPSDSSQVSVRIPAAERISELKADRDFSWLKAAGQDYSWWGSFWSWLSRQFYRLLQGGNGGDFWNIFLTRILPWLLVLSAAFLVIVKILGIEIDNFLMKKPVSVHVPFGEVKEDIRQIDFNSRLETALQQRDYRLAIRLYYLEVLQQLSEAGLIERHPEKTNRHYLREIGNPEVKNMFSRLTFLFEYVWYGEFNPREFHFEQAKKEFQELKTTITNKFP